jgi:hypothetical protein
MRGAFILFVLMLLVIGLITMPVSAGGMTITSFTGDCDSVTVTYVSTLLTVDLTITNLATGGVLASVTGLPANGSYTATFSPPVATGTNLEAANAQWASANLTITTCPVGSSSVPDSDGDEPYHELCNDGRANKNLCEPVAIYPIETDDGIGITVWDTRRTGSRGQLLYLAAEELASLTQNICVLSTSEDNFVSVFSFSGDIVVIAGPDDESKSFIFYFKEFPSIPAIDTRLGRVELNLPACFD